MSLDFMDMFAAIQRDRPGAQYIYKDHPQFDNYPESLKEAVRCCARTVTACDVALQSK
jgi:hypothetical protein